MAVSLSFAFNVATNFTYKRYLGADVLDRDRFRGLSVFETIHRFIGFDDRRGLNYLILLHNVVHGLTPLSQN